MYITKYLFLLVDLFGHTQGLTVEKKDFMIHRKTKHVNSVSECFKNENGWCRFGEKNCWFRHEKESSYSKSENS
jgi:hypothetical protein